MSSEMDVATSRKKKRKNNVDSNEQVVDKDRLKKKKSKVLGDMSEGVPDLDTDGDINIRSSEGKKNKDRGQKDNKRERGNKGKTPVDIVNEESLDGQEKNGSSKVDAETVSQIESNSARDEGHQKKKKKKKKTESSSKLSDDNVSSVDNHTPHEVNDTVQPVKKKKKEKKVKELVDASLITDLSGSNGEDDRLGGDSGNEHTKKKKKENKKTKAEKSEENEFADADKFVGDVSSIENTTDQVEPVKVPKRKKKNEGVVFGATISLKKQRGDGHENVISAGTDSGISNTERNKASSKSKKRGDSIAGTSTTENIIGTSVDLIDETNDEVNKEKKRKKKKKDASLADTLAEELGNTTHSAPVSDSEERMDKSIKKRKRKSHVISNDDANVDVLENDKGNEATEASEDLKSSKKSKKVKFSENVEVFPLHDSSSKGKKKQLKDGSKDKSIGDDGLIRGKRFSKEEDEIVRDAVLKYIEDHQLGEQGVQMVMKCKSHPEIKDCWKEIGEALPHRPYVAVYYRAHILFERSESRKWTAEEIELVKKFHEKHGPDWRTLSDELGKHRFHVKDVWRRIRLPNKKKGSWSQEEYQELFNLVNTDLNLKAFTEKKTKHGMIRDNICWEAISEQLSTRSNSVCCLKWYRQLVSPMVAEGLWSNTDDYKLLIELSELDSSCEEDVDWDNLLEHRSGDVCRKRWNQMVRHIGEHGKKSFSEQVEVLSQRYCANILEARESYDNKIPVD